MFVPFGVVVLMIAIKKETNSSEDSRLEWGRLIIEMYKKYKNDVTLSPMVNHHYSKGSVYYFRNGGTKEGQQQYSWYLYCEE